MYVNNFDDEIICNYLVSTDMKKVWNKQLEMLDILDKVCKKYNITYFADSGTLIGAIRHKGYIPWDDDIDIVMKRADYNKFLTIASKEFKFPFLVQTVYSDNGYFRTHAQIRNSNTTAILKCEEKYNYKFNQGIFIDIFPLDEIPDNNIKLKIQLFRLKVLKFIMYFGYQKFDADMSNILKFIIKYTYIIPIICKLIVKVFGFKNIFKKYEKIASKYNGKRNNRISYIAYSLGKEKHIWKKEWFSKTKRVKFENQMIDIPIGYDERLKKEYGDYMKMVRGTTEHGNVILDPEKPYTEYLSQKGE